MKRLFLSLALALGIFNTGCIPAYATVQSTIDKKIYQGDGIATSFSFPYNIYLATDVAVYETVTATNNTTQLTLNTNYTVTLTAISGVTGAYTATINLAGGSSPAGALAVGTQLTILRSLPLTQLINISDYSATPAATWNQAFDRSTILVQQMQEQINRAILAPVNSTAPSGYTLPNPVANAYIGWDATGTFLTNLIAAQPLGTTASPTFAGLTITGLNGIAKYSSGVLGTANADVDYSVPNGVETLTNKTYDTTGTGNVFKVAGTTLGATGVTGSGKVVLGSGVLGSGSVVEATSLSGNSGIVGQTSGTLTSGHCIKSDANGNLIDNGSACSGGSGMTYPNSSGIVTTNSSAWTTSISGTSSQFVKGDGSLDSTTYVTGTPWTTASTSGNAATATALAASPTNCSAGQAPQGINASGVAQNCTAYTPATAGSAILSGNGSGSTSNVTIGTGLSFTGGTLSVASTSTDYSSISTIVGWTSYSSKSIIVNKVGNIVFVNFYITGTSNSTSTTFTVPYTTISNNTILFNSQYQNNGGAQSIGNAYLNANDTVVHLFTTLNQDGWTASGAKGIQGQFWYQSST